MLQQQEELKSLVGAALPGARVKLITSGCEDYNSDHQLHEGTLLQPSEHSAQCTTTAHCYSPYDVVLNVISFESGSRQLLGNVGRTATFYADSDSMELTVEKLHSQLSISCECTALPDPDLVLVAGPYLSSNGFPPWSLRLAEFQRTPAIHKIDDSELNRILREYARVEQRYGR